MVRINLFFCAFILLFFVFAKPIAAQSNVITVSPQLLQLDLGKDNPEAIFSYTNSTNQTVELTLSMEDVRELEDRGIPDILNRNESKNYKYGLSSWATFSTKSLVIQPGETKSVTVFIDKSRLSQGGHYASLLAEVSQIANDKSVKLRAILASLLFVRTGAGFEREQAEVNDIVVNQDYYSFPSSISFLLHNTGNVDLTPYGVITISDAFGHRVAKGIINENSLITLPDSNRKYGNSISKHTRFLVPGIYIANLEVNYGRNKTKITKTVHFMTLGSISAKALGVLVLVLVGAVIVSLKFPRKKESV